ncbi:MAG TPA: hypothetical protein VLY63_19320, partial [Anaerolineae bacterium]|nr:hypothetical protein [Anaerolineae bacterium]
ARIDPQATIDIIPWEISLLFAHDLAWQPRPIIQSYASFTPLLDDLDAKFLQSQAAPSQLIYSARSIDGRYAIFDTPHTFRTLLDHYRYVSISSDGAFILLERRTEPLSREPILISEGKYRLEDAIPIPRISDGYVYARVDLQPSLLGALVSLLYKPPELQFELRLRNDETVTGRLVRETARNGLFVSRYVRDTDDIPKVFQETGRQDIRTIRLMGSTWAYSSEFEVQFYEIPHGP